MIQASKNSQSGFIALISAIIISLLLITITVALNFSAFFGRFNVLDTEFKSTSVALAEACADIAMLEIAKGNTPAPNTVFTVDENLPFAVGASVVGIMEKFMSKPPVTRAMLEVLDHDDAINPDPATTRLGIRLTSLDEMLRQALQ